MSTAGTPGTPGAPSLSRQKTFIEDNATILNRETKLAILSRVMMEIYETDPDAVIEVGTEVDIDLDRVEQANPEVLTHIYNMVKARLDALNRTKD